MNSEPKADEHIIHIKKAFDFKTDDNYDFLRKGFFKSLCYYFSRAIISIILNIYDRIFFGLKIRGTKNIKTVGKSGAVVVCNHVHLLDCTFIDCAIPVKRMYYTTLESNFGIPIARHLIRWFGGVPIPAKIENLKTFMLEMDKALKCGHFVCMYPEGILYPYFNDLREFKDGAFKIAARSNVPVLPLVITFRKPHGIYRLYKKKPCVTLRILPPIFPAASVSNRKNAMELKNKCYDAMQDAISR